MDTTFQTNYWFGFPESNSDIIINLTHWQYWWWFWFTYLLCLYYFVFLRLIRTRLLKFHPKMVTSYRAHGKWGDFAICILPISWCVNILSNSNFILRMLEWQTESSLFTVRIRGKQWYWVYKIEIKSLFNVKQISKNIGHDNWYIFNTNSIDKNYFFLSLLQIKNNNQWIKEYLKDYYSKISNNLDNNNSLKLNSFNILLKNKTNTINFIKNNNISTKNKLSEINLSNFSKKFSVDKDYKNFTVNYLFKNIKFDSTVLNIYNNFFFKKLNINNIQNFKQNNTLSINNTFIDELDRDVRFNYYSKLKFLKINLNKNLFLSNINLFNDSILERPLQEALYLVIKQKRYVPVNQTSFFKNKSFILNNNNLELLKENKSITKLVSKTSRNKSLNFNNVYYRRLLRTKRILVLPMNTNITLITNSFDVVHSWYIPGLGIKLDCVPGRSTHHTINIDHSGFYYGQCAEICGRYHHHMPIRVCALPFEHFLIWWYHFGLPYFNLNKSTRSKSVKSNIKQFSW